MLKTLPILLLTLIFSVVNAQKIKKKTYLLQADKNRLQLFVDGVSYGEAVELNPKLKPDVWNFPIKNKVMHVVFKTASDSAVFDLKGGDKFPFLVILPGATDTAVLQVVGQKFTNPAFFNRAYRKENKLKTSIEIPLVYELVNIVIAITPSAAKNRNYAYRYSNYYQKVQSTFSEYKNETIVTIADSLLKDGKYANLKMDAYSFEWKNDKIVPSKVYDRIAWGAVNTLRPYLKQLQAFADKTKFAQFYNANKEVYESQVRCYRDSVNLPKMISWLRTNYPSTDYNAFKVIFSPLVSGNQSANSFQSNGFKEAQAHVNFPYPDNYAATGMEAEATILRRGAIVFTELNHSFNDPETEKYQKSADFTNAFSDLDHWLQKGKPASNYNNALACFNEYMNWGLVSLYYLDVAPEADKEKMLLEIERQMKEDRGFKMFPQFNKHLIALYQARGSKPLAELYPDIIEWFATTRAQVQ